MEHYKPRLMERRRIVARLRRCRLSGAGQSGRKATTTRRSKTRSKSKTAPSESGRVRHPTSGGEESLAAEYGAVGVILLGLDGLGDEAALIELHEALGVPDLSADEVRDAAGFETHGVEYRRHPNELWAVGNRV